MERKLKERITGAVILVGLGIVVIPSILDGDVRDVSRTEHLAIPAPATTTVIIPTDDRGRAPVTAESAARTTPAAAPRDISAASTPATETRPSAVSAEARPVMRQTDVSAAERAPPEDDGALAATTEPATRVAEVVPEDPEPEPVVRTAPPPAPRTVQPDPTAGWAVQVGSFASQANADRLANTLTALDYKAFVSRKRLEGRVLYRVRVGPKATRDEALELASRLRRDRQAVAVVPHPG